MPLLRRYPAARIALAYVLFGLAWILVSDSVVALFGADTEAVLQSVKGTLFVVVTGAGLYWVLATGYERLTRSEARYRSLVENLPAMLVRCDEKGVVQYANEAACQTLHARREDLLGRPFAALLIPEDAARLREELAALSPESPAAIGEHRLRGAGEERWHRWTHRRLVDEAGRGSGCESFGVDITERKQAELKLRRDEELLRGIVDHIPVMLVMWDSALRRFTLNPRAEQVLGWTTEAANRVDLMARIYPDPDYRARVAAYMESLESGWREWELVARDGSVIPSAWANVRLSDDTRIGIGLDLRERIRVAERLRRSEQRLRLALEAAYLVAFEWDVQRDEVRRIVSSDPALPATDGPVPGALAHMRRTVFPEDRARFDANLEAALAHPDGRYESEFRIVHPDGEVVWIHERGRVERDDEGRPALLSGLSQDVTDRKRAEALQQAAQAKLEQRVRERTAELTAANRRLQELDQLKSLFIASMSHELRTPLNSVIGFTGLLLMDREGALDDQQRDYLRRVESAGRHLLALVNDVIDVSKVEAGKLVSEPEAFNLRGLVDEAVQSVEETAAAKDLTVTATVSDLTLEADRRRLLQCLVNYLVNAVKYAERGEIRVAEHHDEQTVTLSVRDQGAGIAPGDQPLLFHQFSRIDSPLTRAVPGTGLGLYLTRKLVEEVLGGEVGVESAPGQGSRFWIRIPRRLPADDAPAAAVE